MHIAALLSRCAIEGKTRYNHAMSETVKLSTLKDVQFSNE